MKKIYLFGVGVALILLSVGIQSVLEYSNERDIRISEKKKAVIEDWNKRFPEATGYKHYHCNKLGFLMEAYRYDYVIIDHLMTADNNVPIRCKTDHHQTIENTGKTSTSTLF